MTTQKANDNERHTALSQWAGSQDVFNSDLVYFRLNNSELNQNYLVLPGIYMGNMKE